MLTFKVKAFGESRRPSGQVLGYQASGPGVLVVWEGTIWVKREDGSREIVEAPSVVTWDTGDWVEYGSDAECQIRDYRAATEPFDEWRARVSWVLGDEAAEDSPQPE